MPVNDNAQFAGICSDEALSSKQKLEKLQHLNKTLTGVLQTECLYVMAMLCLELAGLAAISSDKRRYYNLALKYIVVVLEMNRENANIPQKNTLNELLFKFIRQACSLGIFFDTQVERANIKKVLQFIVEDMESCSNEYFQSMNAIREILEELVHDLKRSGAYQQSFRLVHAILIVLTLERLDPNSVIWESNPVERADLRFDLGDSYRALGDKRRANLYFSLSRQLYVAFASNANEANAAIYLAQAQDAQNAMNELKSQPVAASVGKTTNKTDIQALINHSVVTKTARKATTFCGAKHDVLRHVKNA
jgi:hypothetical protein